MPSIFGSLCTQKGTADSRESNVTNAKAFADSKFFLISMYVRQGSCFNIICGGKKIIQKLSPILPFVSALSRAGICRDHVEKREKKRHGVFESWAKMVV